MLKQEKPSEELSELRVENCALREQLSKSEAELHQTQALLASLREDRDKLRTKVRTVKKLLVLGLGFLQGPKLAQIC